MTISETSAAPALASFDTKPYGTAFVRYAAERLQVVCVTNDLTASSEADGFRERFPDRYFSLGMAEQNLVGTLAGLAREGYVPFYPTFSVFGTRRPYEQIALSVAYPALPVRIIGFLPGLTTPGGVTHQSIDDVALMSLLPNMTVLEVGDAIEARTVLEVMDDIPGPVFCRMLRGEVPVLFDSPMQFNKARELAVGDDVLILSTGVQTETTMRIVAELEHAGFEAGHLHISTLKPFTDPLVLERLRSARNVITVENHLVRGGLGSSVAELLAENGISTNFRRIGIQDTFTHGGTRDYLFDYYGLGEQAIKTAVEQMLNRRVFRQASAREMRHQEHNAAVAEGL
ncbi:transketolase [Glaciihabitans sp. INWT7]|uniref:transketolase family protein n=1 Tax=Glaciihabitans sp. INWT7 TaxID=2596912 RepID=UPI001629DA83|nr:transketolase C-terminal domain-containing protein [Glaciihabitans sp. INWT7]QNE46181.1 transketolase [Glaciihabitans sp. INWT7]